MLLGVAIASLLADLLVFPLMETFQQRDWGAVWVYACMGIIGAQGGADGLAGMGPGAVLVAAADALVPSSRGVFILATWRPRFGWIRRAFWEGMGIVGPALPLISLAAQAPLWIVRHAFGWRLVRADASAAAVRPLSIRDLMLAMLIAGLALAAVPRRRRWPFDWGGVLDRLGHRCRDRHRRKYDRLAARRRLPTGNPKIHASASLMALYAMVAVTAVWVVFLFIIPGPRPNAWELTGISIVVLSFATMLMLAALAARNWGYILIHGRRGAHTLLKSS